MFDEGGGKERWRGGWWVSVDRSGFACSGVGCGTVGESRVVVEPCVG